MKRRSFIASLVAGLMIGPAGVAKAVEEIPIHTYMCKSDSVDVYAPAFKIDYSALDEIFERRYGSEHPGKEYYINHLLKRTQKEFEDSLRDAALDFNRLYAGNFKLPSDMVIPVSFEDTYEFNAHYHPEKGLTVSVVALGGGTTNLELRGLTVHELTHAHQECIDKYPAVERALSVRDSLKAAQNQGRHEIDEQLKFVLQSENRLEEYVKQNIACEREALGNQINYLERELQNINIECERGALEYYLKRELTSEEIIAIVRIRTASLIKSKRKSYKSPDVQFIEDFPELLD